MKARLLLAAPFLAALSLPSYGQGTSGFTAEVKNAESRDGMTSAIIEVTNRSGKDARRVFVDCTFFDSNKRPIDIGKALISNLAAGETAFDKAGIVTDGRGEPDKVSCRVAQVTN